MNFWLFLLYYIICTIILGLVGMFLYRLFVKHKCSIVSRVAEKSIDDYFKAYDLPEDFETWRYKDNANDTNR